MNFGADDTLQTGRGKRTYFRVEVWSQVTRIVPKLFPLQDGAGSKLYLASSRWAESTITWDTRPDLGTFLGKTGRVSMGPWNGPDLCALRATADPRLQPRHPRLRTDFRGKRTASPFSTEHWLMAGPRLVLYLA